MYEATKEVFQKTWRGGYAENFAVYEPKGGLSEKEIVATMITPFISRETTALEIGCGAGFWTSRHLLDGCGHVMAIDVIPETWVRMPSAEQRERLSYFEVGDRDYSAGVVPDESVDFVWSFGVFCHLPLPAIQSYLKACHRVMRPGAVASLYFSDNAKRPLPADAGEFSGVVNFVPWTRNDKATTIGLLENAGFTDFREVLAHGKDLLMVIKKSPTT